MQSKITIDRIIEAYKSTGSVWRAGKLVGLSGQSVQERLKRAGHTIGPTRWTDAEDAELAALAPQCTIADIASRMGRTYSAVASRVSVLGIGSRYGNRLRTKLPRPSGLNAEQSAAIMSEVEAFTGSIRQFAKSRSLRLEFLVSSVQRHCPDRWKAYVRSKSRLPPKACAYCNESFTPMTSKQACCSRRCASHARSNAKYFGGQRQNAIGMAEGVCYLCKKTGQKSLSAHHVAGKQNDPNNEYMVALCSGCHWLVGTLAGKSFVADPSALENLLSLAMVRAMSGKPNSPAGVHVFVDIEHITEEELFDTETGVA